MKGSFSQSNQSTQQTANHLGGAEQEFNLATKVESEMRAASFDHEDFGIANSAKEALAFAFCA